MNKKNYYKVAAVIFFIVSLAHLTRIVFVWPVTIGMVRVPVWVSFFPTVFGAILAYWGWHYGNKA